MRHRYDLPRPKGKSLLRRDYRRNTRSATAARRPANSSRRRKAKRASLTGRCFRTTPTAPALPLACWPGLGAGCERALAVTRHDPRGKACPGEITAVTPARRLLAQGASAPSLRPGTTKGKSLLRRDHRRDTRSATAARRPANSSRRRKAKRASLTGLCPGLDPRLLAGLGGGLRLRHRCDLTRPRGIILHWRDHWGATLARRLLALQASAPSL